MKQAEAELVRNTFFRNVGWHRCENLKSVTVFVLTIQENSKVLT
jgi:hypothetical protein